MSAIVLSFSPRHQPPRDWSAQEAAELFRVAEILGRSGLVVETERGLTDEGEPWFAFCRADTGDVIAHFARIDGEFVAASVTLDQTLWGRDLRDIVDQMMRRQPLLVPNPLLPGTAGRSGQGGKDGGTRLFLHPAVILTAFVATALVYARDLDAAELDRPSLQVGPHPDPAATQRTARSQRDAEALSAASQHAAVLAAIALAIAVSADEVAALGLPALASGQTPPPPAAAPDSHDSLPPAAVASAEAEATAPPTPVHGGSVVGASVLPTADTVQPTTAAVALQTALALPVPVADPALPVAGRTDGVPLLSDAAIAPPPTAVIVAVIDQRAGDVVAVDDVATLIRQFGGEPADTADAPPTAAPSETPSQPPVASGQGTLGQQVAGEAAPPAAPLVPPPPQVDSPTLGQPRQADLDLVQQIVDFSNNPATRIDDNADLDMLRLLFRASEPIRQLLDAGKIERVVLFDSAHNTADLITFRGNLLLVDTALFDGLHDFDSDTPDLHLSVAPGNDIVLLGTLTIAHHDIV